MKQLCRISMLALAMSASAGAMAAASYGNIGGPGVYVGNFVQDGEWTINTDNNVQVALRAKNRQTFALIDGSSGVYHVAQGQFGVGPGTRELWNYEFSVNLRADGTGSNDFDGLMVTMRVDIDPTSGTNFIDLDVLGGNWGDNEWWDGTGPERIGGAPSAGEYGVQQSVNPLFPNSGFGFSPGPGLYDLQLLVSSAAGGPLALVTTQVQVPEPSALALVAIALGGLGWASRRRQQKA